MAAKKDVDRIEYIPPPGGQPEILRPALICYGSRCYRKVTGDVSWSSTRAAVVQSTDQWYEDEPPCCAEDIDPELKDIVELKSGEYQLEVDLPSVFYKYIMGREGRTKAQLEKDTKCTIKIPRRNEVGHIVVKGLTMRSVSAARQRIEVLAWSNRECEEVTHFVCVPLNQDQIMESVTDFKNSVLSTHPCPEGLSNEMFTEPSRMHLTLAVFRLFTDKEVQETLSAVGKCVKEARSVFSGPGNISIKGLDTMTDDHTSTSVLYGKVELGARELQQFADILLEKLSEAVPDYVDKRYRVKLHATLINASKKIEAEGAQSAQRHDRRRKRPTFDASGVMRSFGSHNFGQVPLKEVHFSQRGQYDSNGFYKCIRTFPLL